MISLRTITDCYSRGSVTGAGNGGNVPYFLGGFVGASQGGNPTYTRNYSTGSISSAPAAASSGGFVGGVNFGVPVYVNNFYDSTTSGHSDAAAGRTPKTTAEMQDQTTFTGAGWSFTAGTGIWEIAAGQYPILQWQ